MIILTSLVLIKKLSKVSNIDIANVISRNQLNKKGWFIFHPKKLTQVKRLIYLILKIKSLKCQIV